MGLCLSGGFGLYCTYIFGCECMREREDQLWRDGEARRTLFLVLLIILKLFLIIFLRSVGFASTISSVDRLVLVEDCLVG